MARAEGNNPYRTYDATFSPEQRSNTAHSLMQEYKGALAVVPEFRAGVATQYFGNVDVSEKAVDSAVADYFSEDPKRGFGNSGTIAFSRGRHEYSVQFGVTQMGDSFTSIERSTKNRSENKSKLLLFAANRGAQSGAMRYENGQGVSFEPSYVNSKAKELLSSLVSGK